MPQLSILTPIGDLTVSEEDGTIVAVDWGRGSVQDHTPLLDRARGQLQEYFDGDRLDFDLPLAPEGTAFHVAWGLCLSRCAGCERSRELPRAVPWIATTGFLTGSSVVLPLRRSFRPPCQRWQYCG